MKVFRVIGLALATIAWVAPLQARVYVCELRENGPGGIIPEVVGVDYDENSGAVLVYDPFIKHYKGAPVRGRVAVKNGRRITFAWTLEGIKADADVGSVFITGLSYRLTIQNSSHSAIITALPLGFDDKHSGNGKCVLK